jgi:soluble lytic murein transglycosylase-like protein
MFYICSNATRQEKEHAMPAKKFAAALLGSCMCAILPASASKAEDLTGQDAAFEPSRGSGYRIDESLGGFALVTHGLWRTVPAPALSVQTALPIGRDRLTRATARNPIRQDWTSFRRAAYLPHVYEIESRHGLPFGLLDALIWTESRYNPLAVSPAGAAGLGQLMPGTALELGVGNRFDPRSNLDGAARYLKQMLDKFGLVHLALAAYNAGPGAVERARGIPRNRETPAYVSNVLAFWGFR